MNKMFYALVAAVLSAGPAMAAGDALESLTLAVAPSALENTVTPVPAPVPVPAVPGTAVTAENIKGQYVVVPYKFAELRMILADDVTIIRQDPAGDVVCKGVYKLEAGTSVLSAAFVNCGGNDFSLKIGLAGQTLETLAAGIGVMGSGQLAEDVIPMLPIKLKKIS
ncbi:MAG: hypothetical protein AUJ51_08455 [Elusimicrobia bacterium CG1_02_56_21]|nr:MAG: hypothetical protein AUJ51_08455 [Elusimicrobia bacterium CG1_02_56_21]